MIKWITFYIVAVTILIISIITAIVISKVKSKSVSFFSSIRIMFFGIAISSIILFIPIYDYYFQSSSSGWVEIFFASIHNMIRMFIVDCDFLFVIDNIQTLNGVMYKAYAFTFAGLFVLAPILTFGFVLSFFKNLLSYQKYITHFFSDAYVFSALNERSLALAENLKANGKELIVFTQAYDEKKENSSNLIAKANEIGAVCFNKDILSIKFSIHSKKKQLNFFAFDENQADNIIKGLKIFDKYKTRNNTYLYIFSTEVEAGLIISNALAKEKEKQTQVKIKIRRINEVQSLIYRNLYEFGYENIFNSALDIGDEKLISALVVGMGRHGTEMAKALSWFCQMDGYKAQIRCIDINENAEEKFKSLCPELMSDEYNENFSDDNEAMYSIKVYSKVDVFTQTFDNLLKTLGQITYVFVSLGNDELNITAAAKLRALLLQNDINPVIQAIVYNTEIKDAITGAKNYRNEEYNIDFIGDMKTSYSERVVFGTDLEKIALERHLIHNKNEEDFWQYEYNYRSSVARALHLQMKKRCKMPAIDKPIKTRNKNELNLLRKLEHRRWNAYMRSEGYVYNKVRNDIAKKHNCLVPFYKLSPEKQAEDDE